MLDKMNNFKKTNLTEDLFCISEFFVVFVTDRQNEKMVIQWQTNMRCARNRVHPSFLS